MFVSAAEERLPMAQPPPGFEEIERQELSRFYGRVAAGRLFFVPLVFGLAAWATFLEPAGWRLTLLAVTGTLAFGLFLAEAARYRRHGIGRYSIPLSLWAAVLGHSLVTLATGGIESPFLYGAPLLAVVAGVFYPAPHLYPMVLYQSAAIWTFALLARTGWIPDFNLALFGGGSSRGTAVHTWSVAAVLGFVVVAGSGVGRAIRWVFDGTVRRALVVQFESLEAHRDQAQQLSALSAGIAHELKNPLASVKGLAGLLAQGALAGKDAERLAVLRREVDRMQAVLDEFLNFSRPLVPLAIDCVKLSPLCQEIAALHEGLAHQRGLTLAVRAAGSARCDPRKLKQVLINLVQNAIEASAPGTLVEIEAEELADGQGRLRVLDRGHGVDPALGSAIFDAGVTTKPSGSGIGLTVARALARQHGGDLSLSARPGGGSVAEIRLPASPPGATSRGAAA
jgi:two-component system, NtrC family, sensor histidine kinase HydH